jgi:hypothetical protein
MNTNGNETDVVADTKMIECTTHIERGQMSRVHWC